MIEPSSAALSRRVDKKPLQKQSDENVVELDSGDGCTNL